MLVLSRMKDEEVVFNLPDGRRGIVSIVEIRGDKVRLGVEFPADIAVHRREVQDAIDRESLPKD